MKSLLGYFTIGLAFISWGLLMSDTEKLENSEKLNWETPELVDLGFSINAIRNTMGMFDDNATLPGIQPSS